MDSVGPVETGDGGALPDFSRFEQGCVCARLVLCNESSQTYPGHPQPVGIPTRLSICHRTNRLSMGSEFMPELVGRVLPWFMPVILHSRNRRNP